MNTFLRTFMACAFILSVQASITDASANYFHKPAKAGISLLIKSPAPLDSIGKEIVGGKTIILHKVDPKETLFGVARKYKASVADIRAANPDMNDALKTGQTLRIPVKATSAPALAVTKPDPIKEKPKVNPDTKPALKPAHTHIVAPGQSLSGIARTYGISIADIKKWNELNESGLKAGQKLTIHSDGPVKNQTAGTGAASTAAPALSKPEQLLPIGSENTEGKDMNATGSGQARIKESGMAEAIADDHGVRKNLCMHRTAPVGTIISVKNMTNGSTILVRVIGKLPDTGLNQDLVIRVTKPAFEKLGAMNKRFPVEISYLAPEVAEVKVP
ncbi:MAG: LysM peptidoglycan-binding domain-containing protein [Bacteroidota bacterium]